jgi:hypothetical protein
MTRIYIWFAIWMCFCCILAVLAAGCAANAEKANAVAVAPTQAELQRTSRVQYSAARGCSAKCPSVEPGCVDEEGYCYTACAWDAAGKDPAFRAKLHELAMSVDPERSYLITCPESAGGQSI